MLSHLDNWNIVMLIHIIVVPPDNYCRNCKQRRFAGVFSGLEYGWAMKMGQRPMSQSFAFKNQDFDGKFENLMGHLEKNDGPKKP